MGRDASGRRRRRIPRLDRRAAWTRLRDAAQTFDDLGYDHLWTSDHLMASGGDRSGPYFECYSTLAALSQVTRRARLGSLVTCALYRNAGLLAKQAANVDLMSGGRLIFALGGGWDEDECSAYGYPFPPRQGGSRRSRRPLRQCCACGASRSWIWTASTYTCARPSAPLPRRAGHRSGPVHTGDVVCMPPPVSPTWPIGTSVSMNSGGSPTCWPRQVSRSEKFDTVDRSVFRLADVSGNNEALIRLLASQGRAARGGGNCVPEHFIGTPNSRRQGPGLRRRRRATHCAHVPRRGILRRVGDPVPAGGRSAGSPVTVNAEW